MAVLSGGIGQAGQQPRMNRLSATTNVAGPLKSRRWDLDAQSLFNLGVARDFPIKKTPFFKDFRYSARRSLAGPRQGSAIAEVNLGHSSAQRMRS
ncbi:hypothetical protein ACW9H6_06945 [Pseudomonas sp. SDO528_S397]